MIGIYLISISIVYSCYSATFFYLGKTEKEFLLRYQEAKKNNIKPTNDETYVYIKYLIVIFCRTLLAIGLTLFIVELIFS